MAAHVSPDLAAHLRTHRADVTHPFLLDVVCDRLVAGRARVLLSAMPRTRCRPSAAGHHIALRDALVAATTSARCWSTRANPAAIDAAARAIQAERLPEVTTVQRAQQGPPAVLFGRRGGTGSSSTAWFLCWCARASPKWVFAAGFRRFAAGVATVRLGRESRVEGARPIR